MPFIEGAWLNNLKLAEKPRNIELKDILTDWDYQTFLVKKKELFKKILQ
jgi:hypothetical protein